jgi:hypothetical protein
VYPLVFKGHIYTACLKDKIYLAAMKFQVDKHLGKAYTAQQLFIAGLYHYGYIDEKTFKEYTLMYSEKLDAETTNPLTTEQLKSQQKLRKIEKDFSEAIKQWDSMNPKAQQYYIRKARKYRDTVPNAKLLLGLRREKVFSK